VTAEPTVSPDVRNPPEAGTSGSSVAEETGLARRLPAWLSTQKARRLFEDYPGASYGLAILLAVFCVAVMISSFARLAGILFVFGGTVIVKVSILWGVIRAMEVDKNAWVGLIIWPVGLVYIYRSRHRMREPFRLFLSGIVSFGLANLMFLISILNAPRR
jgi:hypothetical protein